MVVDLNNTDLVIAYVKEQAGKGLAHVRALVQADGDALVEAITDLTADEAENVRPGQDEFSVSQVLQHLNSSFARSIDRLKTLSSGQPWASRSAQGPGGVLAGGATEWDEVRRYFIEGEDSVLEVLQNGDETRGLDLTADHGQYGPFNWLQWAAYSHHAHTNDHVEQVRKLRSLIEARRANR